MKTIIINNFCNNRKNRLWQQPLLTLCTLLLCLGSTLATAQNMIENVQYSSLPGNRLQIVLSMSEQAVKPLSFTIDNPARIAFDFASTGSSLPKRRQQIDIGVAQSITAISAKDKTRVILNLTEVVPYQITTDGKDVLITLDSDATGTAFTDLAGGGSTTPDGAPRFSDLQRGISKIDFRRGEHGEGRVVVYLTETNIPMDISEEFGRVVVKFIGAKLPAELHQSLDVLDFATPVKSISSYEKDGNVRIELEPATKDFDHVAYQTNTSLRLNSSPSPKKNLSKLIRASLATPVNAYRLTSRTSLYVLYCS
jgi:type IV pilus assembly protein PilQ